MKKRWLLLLSLVLALAAVSAAAEAGDFDFRSDGRIQGYLGPGGSVTVPAAADGKPVRSLYRNTFKDNASITELCFSEGIESLGPAACYGMSALESVTLPETLAALDEANFTNCRKLQALVLPASLVYMGENCFNWCDALTSVTFLGPVPIFDAYCFSKPGKELVIYVPDDLEEQYRACLPQGLNIRPSGQNAVLPARVTNPDDFSFDADSGTLTAYTGKAACVWVPEEIDGAKVRHIGDYAFEDNNLTYAVFLPQGVESIGYKAFATASALCWAELPDSVQSIDDMAFSGYWGVGFHWPAKLETIGAEAFRLASFGPSLRLPGRLKTIGTEAFAKVKAEEVSFPASLQSIGESAFADSDVTRLSFRGTVLPAIDATAFQGLTLTEVTLSGNASPQELSDAQAYLTSLGLNVSVTLGPVPEPEEPEATPEPTPAVTPEPLPAATDAPTQAAADAPPPDAGDAAVALDKRYVCVSADVAGRTLDASVLGAEYAVTFHGDGTADFVLSGVPVPGLAWRTADGDLVIDYFGAGEIHFVPGEGFLTMDYFGSMLLRLEPEN